MKILENDPIKIFSLAYVLWMLQQFGNILSQTLAFILGLLVNPLLPKGAPLLGNADVSTSGWSGVVIHMYDAGLSSGWHVYGAFFVKWVTTPFWGRDHVFEAIDGCEDVLVKG